MLFLKCEACSTFFFLKKADNSNTRSLFIDVMDNLKATIAAWDELKEKIRSEDLVVKLENCMQHIKNSDEADRLMKSNKKCIQLLQKLIQNISKMEKEKRKKYENMRSIEANLSLLMSYNRKLHHIKTKFMKQGGGLRGISKESFENA